LHQRRHQSFFRPLIALEQLSLEGAVSIPRHLQLDRAHPRGELSLVGAVPVSTPIVGLFAGLSSKMLGQFRPQNLVHDGLEEHLRAFVSDQNFAKRLLVKWYLKGHRRAVG